MQRFPMQVETLFQELYGDTGTRNNVLPEYAEALRESDDGMSVDGRSGAADMFTSATSPNALMPSALPSASAPPSQLIGQYGQTADNAGDDAIHASPAALVRGASSAAPRLSLDAAPGRTAGLQRPGPDAGAMPEASSDAPAGNLGSQPGGEEGDGATAPPEIRQKRRTSAAEPDPLAQPPAATVHAPVLAMDAVPEGSMHPGLLERMDPCTAGGESGAVAVPDLP